ncbi:hypothetical protein H6P81_012012 [Aristolochia fimbriata]|uniref:Uncharacterized protein n=1 Tax=Aristolochia fimbriata TaxID=158543 RepID=A0AAV7EC98_ARIFI|nr:hypothetical protein H6P81_012012 [Aristolochia fimbriata]
MVDWGQIGQLAGSTDPSGIHFVATTPVRKRKTRSAIMPRGVKPKQRKNEWNPDRPFRFRKMFSKQRDEAPNGVPEAPRHREGTNSNITESQGAVRDNRPTSPMAVPVISLLKMRICVAGQYNNNYLPLR